MATPENKVKANIKKFLKEKNVFSVSIAAGPYSTGGISDRLACIQGRFIAIEIKKDAKSGPTKLQQQFIDNVIKAGGIGFVTYSVDHLVKKLKENGIEL